MGLASIYGVCVTGMGLGYLQKKKYGANLTGFSTVAHVRECGQTLTKNCSQYRTSKRLKSKKI